MNGKKLIFGALKAILIVFSLFGILGIIVSLLQINVGNIFFYAIWVIIGVFLLKLISKPSLKELSKEPAKKTEKVDDNNIVTSTAINNDYERKALKKEENTENKNTAPIKTSTENNSLSNTKPIVENKNLNDETTIAVSKNTENPADLNTVSVKDKIADIQSPNDEILNSKTPDIEQKSKTEYNSSSDVSLKYEHNKIKAFLFDSYISEQDGNVWVSKYTYKNVGIYRMDTSFKELFAYDILDVFKEPDNEYDKRAVVLKFHGNTIGYLYKGGLQKVVNNFLSKGDEVHAQIEEVNGDKIFLRLFCCKKISDLSDVESFSVKLTENQNEEMQEDISIWCNVDDYVSIEWDSDKEKYLVSTYYGVGGIGYIPKPKSKYIEELEEEGYEFSVKITKIIENSDTDKLNVIVEIQPYQR